MTVLTPIFFIAIDHTQVQGGRGRSQPTRACRSSHPPRTGDRGPATAARAAGRRAAGRPRGRKPDRGNPDGPR
ncbi:hypothetical protein BL253_08880 [Pseudofrankia asymbiotica]|uniref:Uncharacterized protein n=1 Tax=Pseudofrankia asymbiotica TaxID=1834516 RepID=A0A1V2IFY3_9ACTN|nr:hypothetical protein BL253_08880 [Pseudofrankia asymbiotica]